MLTKLRLKNWRSVKNAEIDLTPITVFIGANSSGKTNILDALRFHRDTLQKGAVETVYELGYKRILSDGAKEITRLNLNSPTNLKKSLQNPLLRLLF